jgi:hypothetical protein
MYQMAPSQSQIRGSVRTANPSVTTIHRDTGVGILQGAGERKAGELRALIGVEDLRLAETGDRLLQCRDAEVGILPTQKLHLVAMSYGGLGTSGFV